jgi:hypothetical protein
MPTTAMWRPTAARLRLRPLSSRTQPPRRRQRRLNPQLPCSLPPLELAAGPERVGVDVEAGIVHGGVELRSADFGTRRPEGTASSCSRPIAMLAPGVFQQPAAVLRR